MASNVYLIFYLFHISIYFCSSFYLFIYYFFALIFLILSSIFTKLHFLSLIVVCFILSLSCYCFSVKSHFAFAAVAAKNSSWTFNLSDVSTHTHTASPSKQQMQWKHVNSIKTSNIIGWPYQFQTDTISKRISLLYKNTCFLFVFLSFFHSLSRLCPFIQWFCFLVVS